MWKIFFEYPDGGKLTVTGKGTITREQAEHYQKSYGMGLMKRTEYQQYPKKYHDPEDLYDVVCRLQEEEE